MTRLILCSVALIAIGFSVVACRLPESPETKQEVATLSTTKEAADKTATNASATIAALQSQVAGLRVQLQAGTPGTAAYADLLRQNQELSARLDLATAVHDQNVAIATDAQNQIADLKARTAKNEAALTAFEVGANRVAAGGVAVAPFTGPAAPWILGISALATAVGTIVGKVHSALVTTPRAVGVVAADAKSALETQVEVASHALLPDSNVAGTQNYVATVVSGLTAGAAALYNAAPNLTINKVNGGTAVGTVTV